LLRKELKERFIEEFTPAEKMFFLRKAEEAIFAKGYRPSEDLFHYCYFHTMKERLGGIRPHGGDGHVRFLLVEGVRDIEEALKIYTERLEADKSPGHERAGRLFIEDLSDYK
jgi:hypothetical protein